MFQFQLRVIVYNVSKICFRLQLGLQPAHSYSVWTPKMNILIGYIYKIICSLFCINQRHDFFWMQQKIQSQDSDLDQFYVALKFLMPGF
jgi:hypothetical protein